MQARALALGIAVGVAVLGWGTPSQAVVTSPILSGQSLAHTLHSFHTGKPAEEHLSYDEYCRYLMRARDTIIQLDGLAAAGNALAGQVANKLADELGEERADFYDYYDYYPCWPRNWFAFWRSTVTGIDRWNGVYAGLSGGFVTGWSRFEFPDGSSGNISLNGVLLGFNGGFNVQNGNWVAGIEASIAATGINGNTNRDCFACTVKNTWLGMVDGRVGYAPGDALLFVKGGGAWGGIVHQIADSSSTTTKTGWTVGGGIEYKLDNNWSAKVEYDHVDLGKVSCAESVCGPNTSTPVQENIFSVGLNWSWATDFTGFRSSDARLKRDIITLGHLENGMTVYRFRYQGSDQVYVGLMAQEVQMVRPDAVVRGDDGYLLVDYNRLGLRMETWEEWVAEQEHRSRL